MPFSRRAQGAAAAAALCLLAALPVEAVPLGPSGADFAGVVAPDAVREVAERIVTLGDHHGRPFGLVDKLQARLYVFSASGRLIGATPVLLGLARGDGAVPGLGDLPPDRIPPGQRTTPAGRYVTEPGRNLGGEDVVWFDYDAGLAIHRLRDGRSRASRDARLAGTDPGRRRVSAGCVVVPVPFYTEVVTPWLGRGEGVLYVLPEERRLEDVLTSLAGND
jgi:hypothetical protein